MNNFLFKTNFPAFGDTENHEKREQNESRLKFLCLIRNEISNHLE